MDAKQMMEAAAVYDSQGRLAGYRLVGPDGQRVLSPRTALCLASSVEKGGLYVDGLKDGWLLDAAPAAEIAIPAETDGAAVVVTYEEG